MKLCKVDHIIVRLEVDNEKEHSLEFNVSTKFAGKVAITEKENDKFFSND